MSNATSLHTSNDRIVWWLLSLFVLLALGGGSLWINSVSSQIRALETQIADLRKEVSGQLKEIQRDSANGSGIRGNQLAAMAVDIAVLKIRVDELTKEKERYHREPEMKLPDKGR